MRIVIDMQGAQTESRFRGIGRYSMSFAEALARNRGEHEIILALSGLFPETIEPIRAAFDGLLPQENIRVWYATGPLEEKSDGNTTRREVAEVVREAFLASLEPDIILISSLFEGYTGNAVSSIGIFDNKTPVSAILYDLIPLLNPDEYLNTNKNFAEYYQRKIQYSHRTSVLLAISASAQKEGLDCLGLTEERIINVSTGISDDFQPLQISKAEKNCLLSKAGISRPFILYTGGADKRKNLSLLIEAWSVLPIDLRQSYQLVFVGNMWEGHVDELLYLANELGVTSDELIFSGYVTDTDLVKLYNLCNLYVFPSWHEGFGLPALEAMACGAPVIASNTSSLPEVIGFDEALFDPFDIQSIAAMISRGLQDENFREQICSHGLKQAKQFSWDKTAKRALAAWATIIKKQGVDIQTPMPRKPILAFVSPMPPERTGIAYYSAELLPALSQFYEIQIVTTQDHVDCTVGEYNAAIRDLTWLKENSMLIDRIIYQVGNSHFHQHMIPLLEEIPGIVVLHDFYLSSLFYSLEYDGGVKNAFCEALYLSHGYSSLKEHIESIGTDLWDCCVKRYPANFKFLKDSIGIIVHSNYSCILAEQWYDSKLNNNWKIIPHLRAPAKSFIRDDQRKKLGFKQDDFVICSFGFIGPSKLNHILLTCWLNSKISKKNNCHLIFVGENHGGNYGTELLSTIESSGCAERIHITGFAAEELYVQYLAIADLAVQLRTDSRGETSGTVLDCMNYNVPIICNANGSMADLDADTVCLLPDVFQANELIEALEVLWLNKAKRQLMSARGRQIITDRHAPSYCAAAYRDAIENFYSSSVSIFPKMLSSLSRILHAEAAALDNIDLHFLANTLGDTFPAQLPVKRIFLDVSATSSHDLKTGIERVVNALVLALISSPPTGYRIEPVYLSDVSGCWQYRYARNYTLGLLGCPVNLLEEEVVDPQNGDLLIGLDISGIRLINAERAGLHAAYRALGCKIFFILYDLLPLRIPHLFPPDADINHKRWMLSVIESDGVVCISEAVAEDLRVWIKEQDIEQKNRRPFEVHSFHLGADISNAVASIGLPEDFTKTINLIQSRPTFLMVGTIEPRKGYLQTIQAFNDIWQQNVDINLVIVGKEGWQGLPEHMRRNIPETIQSLQNHPELGKRLLWLQGISDEYLDKIYSASTCLIAASYGEGFGLPLIEAAHHKLPILARDIPVFREVVGNFATYFPDAKDRHTLVKAINDWLESYRAGIHIQSKDLPCHTWEQSARQLIDILMNNHSSAKFNMNLGI